VVVQVAVSTVKRTHGLVNHGLTYRTEVLVYMIAFS
jgi:hypothetical protein